MILYKLLPILIFIVKYVTLKGVKLPQVHQNSIDFNSLLYGQRLFVGIINCIVLEEKMYLSNGVLGRKKYLVVYIQFTFYRTITFFKC